MASGLLHEKHFESLFVLLFRINETFHFNLSNFPSSSFFIFAVTIGGDYENRRMVHDCKFPKPLASRIDLEGASHVTTACLLLDRPTMLKVEQFVKRYLGNLVFIRKKTKSFKKLSPDFSDTTTQ